MKINFRKNRQFFTTAAILLILNLTGFSFAEDAESESSSLQKSPLSIYLTVDGAYYPESEFRTSCAHLSKITGAYYGLEGRATLNANYKINTPLGENWLLKDAKISLNSTFEISPVSFRPKLSFDFTPLPFLVFSAGGSVGTGWKAFGFTGMCKMNIDSASGKTEYSNLTPFKSWYYDYWAQGAFQFDTGALIPGDWTHVVFLASYQIIYKALTGLSDGEIGKWQGTDNFANGWQYDACCVLAYQMPKMIYRVGIMSEISGHFKDSDYGELGSKSNYFGSFATVSLSPVMQMHLTKKDNLTVLAEFSCRRSFEEEHSDVIDEPLLHYIGYEWYFRRIALSFSHNFK